MFVRMQITLLIAYLLAQIADVKAKVQQEKGDAFPVAHQVLIFQGKVGQYTYTNETFRPDACLYMLNR